MTIERMHRRTLLRGGIAVLGAAGLGTMGIGSAFAGSARPQAATVPGWLPMPEKPQNLIASLTGQDVAPGSAVAISNSGGRFLSLNGYSDLEAQKPLQISDRFGFRSVTKSFVGTVILQLVAEGRLRLDEASFNHLRLERRVAAQRLVRRTHCFRAWHNLSVHQYQPGGTGCNHQKDHRQPLGC